MNLYCKNETEIDVPFNVNYYPKVKYPSKPDSRASEDSIHGVDGNWPSWCVFPFASCSLSSIFVAIQYVLRKLKLTKGNLHACQ